MFWGIRAHSPVLEVSFKTSPKSNDSFVQSCNYYTQHTWLLLLILMFFSFFWLRKLNNPILFMIHIYFIITTYYPHKHTHKSRSKIATVGSYYLILVFHFRNAIYFFCFCLLYFLCAYVQHILTTMMCVPMCVYLQNILLCFTLT